MRYCASNPKSNDKYLIEHLYVCNQAWGSVIFMGNMRFGFPLKKMYVTINETGQKDLLPKIEFIKIGSI